jgi:hypothetical protein
MAIRKKLRKSTNSTFELKGLPHSLRESLTLLDALTVRLRFLSIFVFTITLLNIASVLATIALMKFRFSLLVAMNTTIIIVNASLFVISLLAIVMYESWRRRGDAVFEEISDEIQWNVGYRDRETSEKYPDQSPPIVARVMLRNFARTTDLPLVPGKFGPAIYAAVNVLSTFFLVFSAFSKF